MDIKKEHIPDFIHLPTRARLKDVLHSMGEKMIDSESGEWFTLPWLFHIRNDGTLVAYYNEDLQTKIKEL